ncbi:MAG: type II toxin-antitoxin system RelE/ParE family toxin [Rhodopila sp.]|jgi:toxin ParE1/3/4
MTGYRLSPRAQADLEDIRDYAVERWGGRQAEAYTRQIYGAVEAPAVTPGIARRCDEVRPGYWKHLVGAHVIFFRRYPYGIDVVRILHGRMDFERHL